MNVVLNFAHRGSLTEAPENTLPAFQKAIDHGANGIELDVQLTKDDQLVVCHNHTFSKYNASVTGRIRDYTLEEVKQIDVGSVFSEAYKGVTLPTLAEVLEICPSDVKLNVEIKNIPVIYPSIEKILLNCLREHDRLDNLVISSFDHLALENVQRIAPNVELGMLFYYRILRAWEYARHSGLNISSIHPNNVYTTREFVESCKEFGFKVYPYTVNSVERYADLVNFGVDGVFSNNPGVFRR